MYFRVRFPDVGAGRTRLHCYVEGDSKAAVRKLADAHPHFRSWDASKGTVKQTNLANRKSLKNRLMDVMKPNAAVLQDGTVLQRSIDAGEVITRTPEHL